ncbi:MAG: AIPR family protein [Phormidium sp. BM_Day4_Bin.17]|nr:AIPR family protein [Phormidium sp. BM_Day4_Bin.17]UCJ11308.1 MAG: AIPR family protein [Phormidium sp. PBR-2020]
MVTNHERLVNILQASKPVKDSLQLSGKAIVEDMEFSRVLVGRIAVTEIATLIERHGERLLERNIRRYLGLQGNRVNESIKQTLNSFDNRNFYFYNNGITLTCDNFSYNALQDSDYQVRVENLQIINGG